MKRLITTIIITLFLAAFIATAGCAKTEYKYICVDGKEYVNKSMCPTNKISAVKKTEAETYYRNYVNAYFVPYGGKVQLVSSYLNTSKGDYLATFVVSVKDGKPYETVVMVDGLTGKVECADKCDYIAS
jgi:hypothetical protein